MIEQLFSKEAQDDALDLDFARAKSIGKRRARQKGALSKYFATESIETDSERQIRATQLQHADPVPHVFSHIKKTYKPIHVVLEGGLSKPNLTLISPNYLGPPSKKGSESRKGNPSSLRVVGELKWVAMEEMEDMM